MSEDLRSAVALLREAASAAESRINLVPSEARMSPLARAPLASDLYSRYFFNEHADPDFWQFRGGQHVGHLEHELTIPALRRLSGAAHVNIRPLSGLNAMLLIVSALGGPIGSRVVCISNATGGHPATTSLIGRLGRVAVPVSVRHGRVDDDELQSALAAGDVSLVYLDLQNTLVELDVRSVRNVVADVSPQTLLHADSSHTLGLILGGVHATPLSAGADSFGGSTHKSFPGPQKGAVFTDDESIANKLRSAQFDLVSSHHFAETLALGLAAAEFEVFGAEYAKAVILNAQTLARGLAKRGFEVAGNPPRFTRTHQVWMTVGDIARVTRIGERLFRAGIAANVQDDLPGLPGAVFRLGVNESTFEGAGPETMEVIADAFGEAVAGEVRTSAAEIRSTFGRPFYFEASALNA